MIDVLVGVSNPKKQALLAAQLPVPNPVPIRALIDTGSSCTCLDPTIIQQLGLVATGTTPMITPTTGPNPVNCNQYDIHLILVHPALHFNLLALAVVESQVLHQGFHLLLGRDVLAGCHLSYQGHSQTFSLCF